MISTLSFISSKPPVISRIGLLCNPLSGRIKNKVSQLHKFAADISNTIYREASTPDKIAIAIDDLIKDELDLLVIAGGDGTVQATLDYLLTSKHINEYPLIAILPAGTTNMTALDLGFRGSIKHNLNLLHSLHSKSNVSNIRQRNVLCVEQNNKKTNYGMFFGTGMIANGVKFFHKRVRPTGVTGERASAIVILRYLLRILLKRMPEELNLVQLTAVNGRNRNKNENYTIAMVSTLDRLLMGTRPYWGEEAGSIHTTLLRESPRRLWRSLPLLLRGNGSRLNEEDGYYSQHNNSLELVVDGDYIIDGELFCSEIENGPIRISASDPINFLSFEPMIEKS